MKKTVVPILIIIMSLLLSAWSPAPTFTAASASAAKNTFTFQNKTGSKLTITLTGANYYTFNLKAGNNKLVISPGLYQYSYNACGKLQTGMVTIKPGAKLLLPKCKVTGMVNVKIANNTNGYLTLNLTGPATYYLSLKPGANIISVVKGKYSYTAWGCGGASASGVKNLTRNGITWTWFCVH